MLLVHFCAQRLKKKILPPMMSFKSTSGLDWLQKNKRELQRAKKEIEKEEKNARGN